MGEVITDPAIDFRSRSYEHGTYRYNILKQVTGETFKTLGAAATVQSTFELPAKVFNMSKSTLEFDILPDSPADVLQVAAFYAKGIAPINRMSLFTRGGVYLADIVDFAKYTSAIALPSTPLAEYVGAPIARAGQGNDDDANVAAAAALAAAAGTVKTVLVEPGHSMIVGAQTNLPTRPADGSNGQVLWQTLPGNYSPYALNTPYEPRVVYDQTYADAPNANSTQALKFSFPLGAIPHSIFALNKDLFFGETLLLQITWSAFNDIGRIRVRRTGADAGPLAGVELSNLSLYLAVEVNRVVAESVIKAAQVGLRVLCPYVYHHEQALAAGANQSIQLRLNRSHGRSLLKVYHTPFMNDAAANYFRHDARSLTSIYTALDNERNQDMNINPSTLEHVPWLKDVLRGSALPDWGSTLINWVWIDDFTGAPSCEWKTTDSVECGLDLTQERIWSVVQTLTAARSTHTFFVTQKYLTIAPGNITLV